MGGCLTSGKKKSETKSNNKTDDVEKSNWVDHKMIPSSKVKVKIWEKAITEVLNLNTPTVTAMWNTNNFVVVQSGCTPVGFDDKEESYMFGPTSKTKKKSEFLQKFL